AMTTGWSSPRSSTTVTEAPTRAAAGCRVSPGGGARPMAGWWSTARLGPARPGERTSRMAATQPLRTDPVGQGAVRMDGSPGTAPRGEPLTVVLADDAVLLREGVRSLLEDEGISVVASVGDGQELLRAVARLRPDLAIVDVRMPPTHTTEGLEAALSIK